jgi:hypothetical protein
MRKSFEIEKNDKIQFKNVRNGSCRIHHRGTFKILTGRENQRKKKTHTSTDRDTKSENIDMTILLIRNYEMTGQQMFD